MAELSEPTLYLSATIEYSTSERPLKFFENRRRQQTKTNEPQQQKFGDSF